MTKGYLWFLHCHYCNMPVVKICIFDEMDAMVNCCNNVIICQFSYKWYNIMLGGWNWKIFYQIFTLADLDDYIVIHHGLNSWGKEKERKVKVDIYPVNQIVVWFFTRVVPWVAFYLKWGNNTNITATTTKMWKTKQPSF